MKFVRKKRVSRLFFIFLAAYLGLLVHLFVIQFVKGEEYAAMAARQRTEKVALEEVERGDILDRNLVSLTGSEIVPKVVLFPLAIEDREDAVKRLEDLLHVDLKKQPAFWEKRVFYLSCRPTEKQIRKIKQWNIPGITVLPVKVRYGFRPLANHVVGYLGEPTAEYLKALSSCSSKEYHLNDLVGQLGLERYYEQQLKGTRPEGVVEAFFDATGRLVKSPSYPANGFEPDAGRLNLVLTIDARIQEIVENIMDKRVKRGAVVVMDVDTGDILAMASRPDFDPRPGAPKPLQEDGTLLDRCTVLYQPGSVFKIVVAAAALEEGIVRQDSVFYCKGSREKLIKCWKDGGHGKITFAEAFAQSCNPVFGMVGLELGADRLIRYARQFGFENQKIIGYPVPVDDRQNLNRIAEPYNLVNCSVGQGTVLATPVQVTAALNTIINDGVYIQPRLVKELRYSNGETATHFPMGKSAKVISSNTARQLRDMLEMVTKEGFAGDAFVEKWGSAGKTGSAQVGGAGSTVNAWFTGYAPLNDPKYVVTVLVEEGISGGVSAAPVFHEIMEEVLNQK